MGFDWSLASELVGELGASTSTTGCCISLASRLLVLPLPAFSQADNRTEKNPQETDIPVVTSKVGSVVRLVA